MITSPLTRITELNQIGPFYDLPMNVQHLQRPPENQDSQPRVEVAVAVVFNPAGQVLWASRPEGKPYAGYWEFPGGKVEPGETVWAALVRELREELGIVATEGAPWLVVEHDYEHARVRLYFYRVWRFEGQPVGLENQTLRWGALDASEVTPILPATEPLLPRLAQPQWMLITQYAQVGIDAMQARLERAYQQAGSNLRVCFREKGVQQVQLLMEALSHCQAWCEARLVPWVVNSQTASELLAQGQPLLAGVALHLTESHLFQRPSALHSVPARGASVHSAHAIEHAFAQDLCYGLLGPVKETQTHPGTHPLGWEQFREISSHCRLPIYAVGGLTWTDLTAAMGAGAHGVAMIRGV